MRMTFITDTIAIGNFIDAEDRATREAAGIRSILCLNGLLQGCKPADCGVEPKNDYSNTPQRLDGRRYSGTCDDFRIRK